MSEARKLIEVIDELERQSEELNSAIDLYRQINRLYVEISNTSLKYEKVFDDIDKAKFYLKEVSKSIENNLENINQEEKIEDIILNVNKLNSNTVNIMDDIKNINDNVKLFICDIKDINKNNEKLNKSIITVNDLLKKNKNDYINKLDESLKETEDKILYNQDYKKNEIIDILNSRLDKIEEKYDKNIKNIHIGLCIVLFISIVNIFI